jgi:hypothetical protein
MKEDLFIERRIVTGLIVSTEYIHQIRKNWNTEFLGSKTAKQIANWCIEFYDEYHTAPGKEIESIYFRKSKGLKDPEVKDIEAILESLSGEYERQEKFNVDYLLDQTKQYLDERAIRDFIDDVKASLESGNITEAKKSAYGFKPAVDLDAKELDLSKDEILLRLEKAFATTSQPVVRYPRQLGEMLNSQLVRGGFIAFMGPEKRGKTWILLDIARRASEQKANVAFFQAGDMSEEQWLMRMSILQAGKSNLEKYSGKMYEPVRDCIKNQLDTCDLKERESSFGPFEGKGEQYLREQITREELIEAAKDNRDYKPCYNCDKYWKQKLGAVWLQLIDTGHPLSIGEAKKVMKNFFIDRGRNFKLSTHTSGSLTVSEMNSILDLWERRDGFVPDIILVDFADILASEFKGEFRHQENDKWMKLRGLSQKRHALVITATWTDSASYTKDTLSLDNFSEDKRKYGHVTAMYGLNQDPKGREKKLGIMRINQIVVREDAFNSLNEVHVLQNLSRGQPCLSSYW